MTNVQITDDQIAHIANLSQLILTKEEGQIKDQLSKAAEYVDVLNEIESQTVNLPPTYQVNQKQNVFRSDEVCPSLSQELAISQSRANLKGYFKTGSVNKKQS